MKSVVLFAFFSLLSFFPLFAQTFTGAGAPIPDNGTPIVFEIPVSGLAPGLDTLNFGLESICINIVHAWSADLSINLQAPDGTIIPMLSNLGGDQDGFVNTCLSGNAPTSVFKGAYPFTGLFRPFGDMGTANNGQDPNGTWKLIILDTYAFADEGQLFDWSITFGSQPCKRFPFLSSDLPILNISTNGLTIVNEPKIDAVLTVIDNGPGQRNFLQPGTATFIGPIGVELHGNSTQGFPKKSFRIETRDDQGEDLDVSLLGLPATSDFVLLSNFSDKTLMRNALSYEMSRRVGQYASRTRFCEVFVDNNYQGVYALTEKIKRGKERVNIAKLTQADTSGTALTGGYILKIDWNSSPGWTSQFPQSNNPNKSIYFQHEYPKWDELHPAQTAYIRNYVDSFEVALAGPDFQEPLQGWRHFAEEKSFIDYLIVNEMSRNVDGYRLSTYFHKDRDDKGGKLSMGPAWDFDLAWYNADYCENFLTNGWAYDINYVCDDAGVPFWWERLMQDSLFTQHLACRWQTLRATTLHRDRIVAAIDSMAAIVQEAQGRNFKYWDILGTYVWPNPGPLPATYAGEVQKMKGWMIQRLSWLDLAFSAYLPELNANFEAEPGTAFHWQFTPQQVVDGYQYVWDFGDGTTSSDPNVLHQFPGSGTYHVRLTVSTPYGCDQTTEQIIHIISTGTVDHNLGGFQVYPNPVHDRLHLRLPDHFAKSCTVRMFNSLGENVMQQEVVNTGVPVTLSLSHLVAGVYSMELFDGTERAMTWMVVR